MLVDGLLKGRLDLRQAMLENVAEADQDRQVDAADLQPVDKLLQIDRSAWDPCRGWTQT